MKVFVKLLILVGALLLVTNMAFAQCDQELCYEIVTTNQDDVTYEWGTMWVCLRNDGTGDACADGACGDLYLFGGGPGWFNTSGYPGSVNGNPRWTTWIFSEIGEVNIGFINPIGEGELVTGEAVAHDTRYIINGKKVPLSNCEAP